MTLVSVLITNHDYADFLPAAVDGALAQDWPDTEVVVVDDGSSDGSLQVLDRYRGRVRTVLQDNRGQAAAFAAGLAEARGEVVIFLDADDTLLPTAASAAVRAFAREPGAVKVSWPMLEIDAGGRRTGSRLPDGPLPSGDLRPLVDEQGADCYLSSPTSGNAWSRTFLERVLPAPEEEFRRGADGYLITLAPLHGLVEALPDPHSCYRVHGRNGFWKPSLEERVLGALARHAVRAEALVRERDRLGLTGNPSVANPYIAWLRRVAAVTSTVRAVVPESEPFLLVDGGEWSPQLLAGRPHACFPERDGVFWGPPADDAAARAELDRHLRAGLRWAVVGWPAAWWLDAYPALATAMEPVHRTDDVLVARLCPATGRRP